MTTAGVWLAIVKVGELAEAPELGGVYVFCFKKETITS